MLFYLLIKFIILWYINHKLYRDDYFRQQHGFNLIRFRGPSYRQRLGSACDRLTTFILYIRFAVTTKNTLNSPAAATTTTHHQQANTQQTIKRNTWRPHTRIQIIIIIIVIRATNHYNYYIRVYIFFCRLHFGAWKMTRIYFQRTSWRTEYYLENVPRGIIVSLSVPTLCVVWLYRPTDYSSMCCSANNNCGVPIPF